MNLVLIEGDEDWAMILEGAKQLARESMIKALLVYSHQFDTVASFYEHAYTTQQPRADSLKERDHE